MLKIEAQLSALKSYVDCELSTLTSKIDAFSDSLKHTLANLQKRESNYANTDLLQQSIASLENKLKQKIELFNRSWKLKIRSLIHYLLLKQNNQNE